MNLFVLILLGEIVVIDLFLELTHRRTISEWYQALFPTWVDICNLTAFVIAIGYFLDVNCWIKLLLGTLAGHLFWPNKERHK